MEHISGQMIPTKMNTNENNQYMSCQHAATNYHQQQHTHWRNHSFQMNKDSHIYSQYYHTDPSYQL